MGYRLIRSLHHTNKVVFYLHGPGGGMDENPWMENMFSQDMGVNFIRMEAPLVTAAFRYGDFIVIPKILASNTGTLFQLLHNSSKAIDAIAEREGFSQVGIVGVSYGGLKAIINAIHSSFAKRIILLSSTPDILYAIENYLKIFHFPEIAMILLEIFYAKYRQEARRCRRGEGQYQEYWDSINPWQRPANGDVHIYCIGNSNDPVMGGRQALESYKKWMAETQQFQNVHLKLVDGPAAHTELVNIDPGNEMWRYFGEWKNNS